MFYFTNPLDAGLSGTFIHPYARQKLLEFCFQFFTLYHGWKWTNCRKVWLYSWFILCQIKHLFNAFEWRIYICNICNVI